MRGREGPAYLKLETWAAVSATLQNFDKNFHFKIEASKEREKEGESGRLLSEVGSSNSLQLLFNTLGMPKEILGRKFVLGYLGLTLNQASDFRFKKAL